MTSGGESSRRNDPERDSRGCVRGDWGVTRQGEYHHSGSGETTRQEDVPESDTPTILFHSIWPTVCSLPLSRGCQDLRPSGGWSVSPKVRDGSRRKDQVSVAEE